MKLLELEDPSEFHFADDCAIDDSGIFAKPLDSHAKNLLAGKQWDIKNQFEEDIKLELPCSAQELKLWSKINDFDDVLEKLSRIKGIAHTTALRKVGSPFRYTDDQRNHNIITANMVLDSSLVKAEGDLRQYTHLNVQKLTLVIEQHRVQKATYSDEAGRENRLDNLSNKIKEINWFLNDCHPVDAPFLQNSELITEESHLDKRNKMQPKGRRGKQIALLLAEITQLNLSPMAIPVGKKAIIRDLLVEKHPAYFTASGFDHAWKTASTHRLISIQDKEKYLRINTGQ